MCLFQREQRKATAAHEALRQEMEDLRSHCHELEQQNALLLQRNQDLVEAYWPIMQKLKSLEHTHQSQP